MSFVCHGKRVEHIPNSALRDGAKKKLFKEKKLVEQETSWSKKMGGWGGEQKAVFT